MYKKQARKSAFDNRCVSVYECRMTFTNWILEQGTLIM